jgi:hypothetical protein
MDIQRGLARAFFPVAGIALGALTVALVEHLPRDHWLVTGIDRVTTVNQYVTPRGMVFVGMAIAVWAVVYVLRGFDER